MTGYRHPMVRACAWAFLAGAGVIGPLDYFHAATGVEDYLRKIPFTLSHAWPIHVPFQMGLIGVILVLFWTVFHGRVLIPVLGAEGRRLASLPAVVLSVAGITGGYLAAWILLDSPHYSSWCVLLFSLSLLSVILAGSPHQTAAFVLVALIGIWAEWLLLSPGIGYYRFARPDWFGRSSSWLLPTYGWVGLFIHELSRKALGGSLSQQGAAS
ncbi:MAG: hypothetical protein KKA60_02570 [Proteobacteria bacterium]|nr:hypothetical protein [Pseudomonadota bacterium]